MTESMVTLDASRREARSVIASAPRVRRDPTAASLLLESSDRNEGSRMLYRQGDVLIARIDEVPEDLEAVPRDKGRVVLAYGEVTGHAHAVQGDVELLTPADVTEMDERFLRAVSEALVVHEEHDTIVL